MSIRKENTHMCLVCYEDIELADCCILPCAHIGCATCFGKIARGLKHCPNCRFKIESKDCMRLVFPAEMSTAWRRKLGPRRPQPAKCDRYGSKIQRLLEHLDDIFHEDPDSRVLIFVQWANLKAKVAASLKECGVRRIVLDGAVWARSRLIKPFQAATDNREMVDTSTTGPSNCCRVLVLSSEDTFSGSNFTGVNHIVLLHPVLANSVHTCAALEELAIGRALRIGQSRKVHVWRFMTKDTVEEEMIAFRKADGWQQVAC